METAYQPQLIEPIQEKQSLLPFFSWLASILVIIIGCFVIVGWMFDIALLKSVLPGLVTMKANTAFGFIFGGISLFLWHQQTKSASWNPSALIFAIIVVLIGLLTLMQYGFQVNFGIDELIFKETGNAVATASPGRMAPNSALNFLFLGSGLVLFCTPRPNHIPAQALTILSFLVALLGFLGYVYGNATFYKFNSSFTAMALHTAVAFMLLCIGILFASPKSGVMAVITSHHAGGIMAQRLYPAAIIIPPVLCWFVLIGFKRKIYTPEMGISMLGILSVIIFSALIWLNARSLGIIDSQRGYAEASLKQAFAELKERVQEREEIANQLATTFNEITAAMNELEASSKTTAEQAATADTEAQRASSLSESGTFAVKQSQNGMIQLQDKVSAIASEIQNTQKQANQIAEISRLVRNIATQTNMLALNAAIEAVRAGENGKGFGVVATEIRQLADQSRTSAEKITTLIAEIQKSIHSTVTVTEEGIKTVESNVIITQETSEAFQGVTKAIREIVASNKQIAMTANQQAVAIEQVVNVVNTTNQQIQ